MNIVPFLLSCSILSPCRFPCPIVFIISRLGVVTEYSGFKVMSMAQTRLCGSVVAH